MRQDIKVFALPGFWRNAELSRRKSGNLVSSEISGQKVAFSAIIQEFFQFETSLFQKINKKFKYYLCVHGFARCVVNTACEAGVHGQVTIQNLKRSLGCKELYTLAVYRGMREL